MRNNLTKIYKNYKGLWVTLDSKLSKVISSNNNAKKAYSQAIKKGYKEPTLFKVPEKNLPYFGLNLYE